VSLASDGEDPDLPVEIESVDLVPASVIDWADMYEDYQTPVVGRAVSGTEMSDRKINSAVRIEETVRLIANNITEARKNHQFSDDEVCLRLSSKDLKHYLSRQYPNLKAITVNEAKIIRAELLGNLTKKNDLLLTFVPNDDGKYSLKTWKNDKNQEFVIELNERFLQNLDTYVIDKGKDYPNVVVLIVPKDGIPDVTLVKPLHASVMDELKDADGIVHPCATERV
jgi:hypothetical protein